MSGAPVAVAGATEGDGATKPVVGAASAGAGSAWGATLVGSTDGDGATSATGAGAAW